MVVKKTGDVKNFLRSEFIGLKVEVLEHTNKTLKGVTGVIVNETKNMFEIKTSKDIIKKVFKGSGVFIFHKNKKKYEINGKNLLVRPWNRVKKKW